MGRDSDRKLLGAHHAQLVLVDREVLVFHLFPHLHVLLGLQECQEFQICLDVLQVREHLGVREARNLLGGLVEQELGALFLGVLVLLCFLVGLVCLVSLEYRQVLAVLVDNLVMVVQCFQLVLVVRGVQGGLEVLVVLGCRCGKSVGLAQELFHLAQCFCLVFLEVLVHHRVLGFHRHLGDLGLLVCLDDKCSIAMVLEQGVELEQIAAGLGTFGLRGLHNRNQIAF